MDFEELVGDRDAKFISYACRWAAEELAKCENENDFTIFPHTITIKLKAHLVEQDEFFYMSHCPAEATEEEKLVAAQRYEDHVNYACAITWAMFLKELEEELERESPAESSPEKISSPVSVDNE